MPSLKTCANYLNFNSKRKEGKDFYTYSQVINNTFPALLSGDNIGKRRSMSSGKKKKKSNTAALLYGADRV